MCVKNHVYESLWRITPPFLTSIFKTSWMQCVVVYGSIYKLTDVVASSHQVLKSLAKKGRHIEVFLNGVVGMESIEDGI